MSEKNDINVISCELCSDLMPLVKDGVASGDSVEAVKRHLESCAECRGRYDGDTMELKERSQSDKISKAFAKLKRQLTTVYAALMTFGIYFGLSLTAGADMFYNCLIMPVVGVFGYLLFRKRALYIVPILVFGINIIANQFNLYKLDERLDFASAVTWAAIYSVFVIAGTAASMLLDYAFGKEDKYGEK